MTDSGLSAQQIAVIDALSNGVTATEAAAQVGIHRNTISNWRRNDFAFQHAFADAQYDRALFHRERAESLADKAYAALEALLADTNTPATVRLKAALYILEKASTPPPPKSQVQLRVEKVHLNNAPPMHNVHNSAQSAQPKPEPIRREHPKIGRNELCPCGSGLKHKRCCLHKPPIPAAA
jgi:preprotein translocase subunit SecA